MGDAKRRRALGSKAATEAPAEPATVTDIASARAPAHVVKPVVQGAVLGFLNAMAAEGLTAERVTLGTRAYGRLLVELASNAASKMPTEVPESVRFMGPAGHPVIIDCAAAASPIVRA